jgi:hypothetical protein
VTDFAEMERLRRRLGPPKDSHPLLETLEREFSLGAGIDDPEVAAIMLRIVHEYIPARLNVMLRYLQEKPDMEVAGVSFTAYVVFRGDHCSINLSLIEAMSRNLHWHPHDALFYRVNPGTSRVHHYRLPDRVANEVVDLEARLDFIESREFAQACLLAKHAESDILDFEASPDAPVVVARLQLPSKGPLDWAFDRRTLSPIGATSNDPVESHLISLIRAAAFFPESDLGLLRRAVLHPSHNVRWAAVQAIGRLDSSAAVALLPDLVRDPHPHVRRAAERTLASLDAREAN